MNSRYLLLFSQLALAVFQPWPIKTDPVASLVHRTESLLEYTVGPLEFMTNTAVSINETAQGAQVARLSQSRLCIGAGKSFPA